MPVRSHSVPSDEPSPVNASRGLDHVPTKGIRQLVRDLLTDHAGIVDDAVLVTDEPVTNAHRHCLAPSV